MELDTVSLLAISEYFFSSPSTSLLSGSSSERIRRTNMRRRNQRNMKIALLLHEVFDDSDDSLDENDLDIYSEGENDKTDDEVTTIMSNQDKFYKEQTSWVDNSLFKTMQPSRRSDSKKNLNQKLTSKTKLKPSASKAKSMSKINSKQNTSSFLSSAQVRKISIGRTSAFKSVSKITPKQSYLLKIVPCECTTNNASNSKHNTGNNLTRSTSNTSIRTENTTVDKDSCVNNNADPDFDPESLISEVEVDVTEDGGADDPMHFDGVGEISIADGVHDVLQILENVQSPSIQS